MTVVTQRFTFEEYLNYSDGTDTRYELVNGELMPMGIGTGLHGAIANFLEQVFDAEIARLERSWTAQKAAISVRSPCAGRWDTSRIPDVAIVPVEQWLELRDREAVIELNQPSPLLVVEVVSASTQTADYRAKRSEYSVLEILEYWIVDPLTSKVTVCILNEGFYDATECAGSEAIQSPTFPGLSLTSSQVLEP